MKRLLCGLLALLVILIGISWQGKTAMADEVSSRVQIYHQHEGAWCDKPYSPDWWWYGGKWCNNWFPWDDGVHNRYTLANGGCGVFALCHAAQWLGVADKDTYELLPNDGVGAYLNNKTMNWHRSETVAEDNKVATNGMAYTTDMIRKWYFHISDSNFRWPAAEIEGTGPEKTMEEVFQAGGVCFLNFPGHWVVAVKKVGNKVLVLDSCEAVAAQNNIACYQFDEASQNFSNYSINLNSTNGASYWIDEGYADQTRLGGNYLLPETNNKKYNVTFKTENGGSITMGTSGQYASGKILYIKAEPREDFVEWKIRDTSGGTKTDGAWFSTGGNFTTFCVPTADCVVTAVFKNTGATYPLTVTAGTGGTANTNASGKYAAQATISLTATPSSGYSFKNWTTSNGGSFANDTSQSTTFTMPANATTVTANFVPNTPATTYTLTAAATTGGTAYVSMDGKYFTDAALAAKGQQATIKAVADAGYTFTGWTTSNGGSFASPTSQLTTFTMPANATTVTANFVPNTPATTYTLTAAATTGGTAYVSMDGKYFTDAALAAKGQQATIKAVADAGYTFTGWTTSNGGSFASPTSQSTTFTMPANATTVTANFQKNVLVKTEWKDSDITLIASDATRPAITPSNPQIRGWLTYDASHTFVQGGLFFGSNASAVQNATPQNYAASGTWFVRDTAAGGLPSKPSPYGDGITSNLYYDITSAQTDGFGKPALTPGVYYYKFYARLDNVNSGEECYSKVFKYSLPAQVTVQAGPGGKITTGASGSYTPGSVLTLRAAADSGYRFVNWTSSNGGSFASPTSRSTSFTVPSANTTVTANFTLEPVYGLTVTPTALDFGTQTQGFTPVGQTVTIQNTGDQVVSLNTLNQPQYFQVTNYSKTTLQPGEKVTATILPKTGLAAGKYDTSFYITINELLGVGAQITVKLTVNPKLPDPVPPTITTDSLPGGTVGQAYSHTLSATGDATISWSIASGTLPDGLTLTPNGVLSGTPQKEGTFSFTVKASNGVNPDATKAFTITVEAQPVQPVPPTITTDSLPGGTVGQAYSHTLSATGDGNIFWSIASGSLPDGLTLTPNGALSGTPQKEGTFTFTVKASNGVNPDATKAFTITVEAQPVQPVPPTITTDSLPGGTVGQAYSQTLSATGDPTITWSIASGSLPDGLTLTPNGALSGTPQKEGTFSFTVMASNGVNPDATKAFTITVEAQPVQPVAPTITTDSLPGGTVGQAYSHTLSATGDATISWSIASGTLPDGLTLTPNGVLSGTPQKEGTFSFTVKASNGVNPDATKAFTITVEAQPVQPVAPTITTDSLPGGTVGQAYSHTLSATGDGNITWSIASGTLPDGLTLTPNGTLSGTPQKEGTFSFTVKASNGVNPDATKAFTITVEAQPVQPVPPTITTDSLPGGTVGQPYNQTLSATGDPTISWIIASGSLPDGLTLTPNGALSGTPQKEGTFSFTVMASNGVKPDAVKEFYISVQTAVAPAVPKTGDETRIEWLSLAAVLSAALFIGLSMKRKRKA